MQYWSKAWLLIKQGINEELDHYREKMYDILQNKLNELIKAQERDEVIKIKTGSFRG
jgi:hypothetical protein